MSKSKVEVRERSIKLDDRDVPYRLERKRGRRRLSVQVEPRTGLRVLAPLRLPLRDVDAFLRQERDWLREKMREIALWEQRHPLRSFETGERLPLLGEPWPLVVREEVGRKRARIRRSERGEAPGTIELHLPGGLKPGERREEAARALESWYRRLARQLLEARVAHWTPHVGHAPMSISIRDTKSRWGSCSSAGGLSFCWRIVMAPPRVVDYLVVHELCHLEHPDHSPRFWSLVESFLPDCDALRRWLRDHGQELYL